MKNTFSIYQNDRFHKLISKLMELDICTFEQHHNGAQKIICKDETALSQIFQIVFLLYATPNEPLIAIDSDKSAVMLKGQFINFSIIDKVSYQAKAVLEILLSKEDDATYEEAFNSLLCIYIGTMTPLKVIYPNTYVRDLGDKSHEIDIYFETINNECFMIETTRGFAKDKEKIDDTYSWHFKKAVFRKWMLEKFYPEINCKLCYLTLHTTENLGDQPAQNAPSSFLQEEINDAKNVSLTQKIIEQERGNILFLSLGRLTQSLALSELESLLHEELLEKLRLFVVSA
jgi:hypothetical protein